MPNKPINFEFTSDTDKYEKGLKDAERATRKLGDDIEDLPDSSGKAARGIKSDMDKVEDEMADAGKEGAQEFKSNLGESLASGDLSTILQDTMGGLVSGLSGPLAGAAAVFAGVAALGFQQVQKKAEEVAAATESIMGLMRDRFGMIEAEMDKAFKRGQLKEFVTENIDLFQKLTPQLERMGVGADEYSSAMLEGGAAAKAMEERIRGILQAHTTMEGPLGHQRPVYDDIAQAAQATLTALTDQKGAHKDAAAEAATYDTIMNHSSQSVANIRKDWEWIAKQKPVTLEVKQKTIAAYGTANPYGVGGGMAPSPVYAPKKGAAG